MKAPIFSAYTASQADTAAIISEVAERAAEAANEQADDPNNCPHCAGAGTSHDQPDGCSGCNGSGQRQRGYWNNYGRDWEDREHDD